MLCVFDVMKIKRLVREGLKTLQIQAARWARKMFYFVYLQQRDEISEDERTLNGLL